MIPQAAVPVAVNASLLAGLFTSHSALTQHNYHSGKV